MCQRVWNGISCARTPLYHDRRLPAKHPVTDRHQRWVSTPIAHTLGGQCRPHRARPGPDLHTWRLFLDLGTAIQFHGTSIHGPHLCPRKIDNDRDRRDKHGFRTLCLPQDGTVRHFHSLGYMFGVSAASLYPSRYCDHADHIIDPLLAAVGPEDQI